jgi:hypothetical protein
MLRTLAGVAVRQPLLDVAREEWNQLVVAARTLVVVIILLALAVFVVVNN